MARRFGGKYSPDAGALEQREGQAEPARVLRRQGGPLVNHKRVREARHAVVLHVRKVAERVRVGKFAVLAEALRRRLLLLNCGSYKNVIRWIPPLVVKQEQLSAALATFNEALATAAIN